MRLTWPEDAEDEVARDEDAMTEANDELVDEDASSSACGVTSEGRKKSLLGIRFAHQYASYDGKGTHSSLFYCL